MLTTKHEHLNDDVSVYEQEPPVFQDEVVKFHRDVKEVLDVATSVTLVSVRSDTHINKRVFVFRPHGMSSQFCFDGRKRVVVFNKTESQTVDLMSVGFPVEL